MNHLTIKNTLLLLAFVCLSLCGARAGASEDPEYGAPLPMKIAALTCEGLSEELRDSVLAADFTGVSKSCRVMCQACGVCKCLTGKFDAVDPALGYSLMREHVSCEGTRYTLEAGGRTYACEAPRIEYPTIKAPAGLHYPGAATIGYAYDIETLVRRKTYVLSTAADYDDVITYYEIEFAVPAAGDRERGVFERSLDTGRNSVQRVEVEKNGDREVLITITTRTSDPDAD